MNKHLDIDIAFYFVNNFSKSYTRMKLIKDFYLQNTSYISIQQLSILSTALSLAYNRFSITICLISEILIFIMINTNMPKFTEN